MTLGLLERLKNKEFISRSKMTELNQNKSQNNQIDQMLCESCFVPWK